MKKLLLIFFVCFASSKIFAQQEPYLVKSLSNEMIKKVEATTSGGNISVVSVPSDKTRIEVFAMASGKNGGSGVSKEEIRRRMEEYYELTVQVADNKLTAVAKSKTKNSNWKDGLSISFKIFVSKNVTTRLTTSGGNIDLKSLTGEQQFTTSGGNLTIDEVFGKLKGKTSGGNIYASNSGDEIDLVTSGGNVKADHCKGLIKLTTSGGNIEMANLDGDVNATTSGGDVRANEVKGTLASRTSGGSILLAGMACDLNASTSGGDIKVAVKESRKMIKLSNSGGKIELQLPAGKGYDLDLSGNKINTGNLTNFSGSVKEDEVNGKINGGGTQVSVKASGGKINLIFK